MRLGANHVEAPGSVPALSAHCNLDDNTIPPSVNWGDDFVNSVLLDGALGNDRLNNCVPVAALRGAQIRCFAAMGSSWQPTEDQAVTLYQRWTGYDPATGQPDGGTDTAAAMSSWCSEGIHLLEQLEDVPFWYRLDPRNHDHLRKAIYYTGPVQATLNLPIAMRERAGERVWDLRGAGEGLSPAPGGAHRVVLSGFLQDMLLAVTWGRVVILAKPFWDAYGIAADATLSRSTWFEHTGLSPPVSTWPRCNGRCPPSSPDQKENDHA
jgi:hypothetical protein